MSQGARTIAELRAEVARLERLNRRKQATINRLRDQCETQYALGPHWDFWPNNANTLPPTDSAPVSSSHSWRSWAAAACNRLRFFFRRLFSR